MRNTDYFNAGWILATIFWAVVIGCAAWYNKVKEESGYSDKLVISYHCPEKEYERQLFRDILKATNVQTNFVNQEMSMDKHKIHIRLTNPKKDN